MDPTVKHIPLPRPVRGSGKPRAKPKRVPSAVRGAADEYKKAYKAVYGVPPRLFWDGQWIRIHGHSEGVTAARLRAMTTQLKLRSR